VSVASRGDLIACYTAFLAMRLLRRSAPPHALIYYDLLMRWVMVSLSNHSGRAFTRALRQAQDDPALLFIIALSYVFPRHLSSSANNFK
jgi:hypothetical protein